MLGTLNVIVKGVVGVTVMMWVRWTLPRLRIDQVITTCLKYCVPIAAVAFLGATLWQYAWPNGTFFGIAETAGVHGELRSWPRSRNASCAEAGQPAATNPRTIDRRTHS